VLVLPTPLGAFQPLKPAPGGPPRFFPGAENENIRTAIAREKQLKRWRREKRLNLIRTIHPEFKDFAQTWGRKMITVHEKMYP
jgi:hypothetical protein